MGLVVRGVVFRGVFIRGGSCPGGSYPGGSCPRPPPGSHFEMRYDLKKCIDLMPTISITPLTDMKRFLFLVYEL